MSIPARIQHRLDPEISYGFERGLEFYTEIETVQSGHEFRNGERVRGQHVYSAVKITRPEDFAALRRLQAVVRGALVAFRFKDWFDWQLVDVPIGTATGASQTLPIRRTETIDGLSYVDYIEAPVLGTVQLKANGVDIASTVDPLNGAVTFTATSGHAITVSCEFDRWVRFETDKLASSWDNYKRQVTRIDLREDFWKAGEA